MNKGVTTASFIPSRWATLIALWALLAVVGAGGPVWAAPSVLPDPGTGGSLEHSSGLKIEEFKVGDSPLDVASVLFSGAITVNDVSGVLLNDSDVQTIINPSLPSFGVFSSGSDAIGLETGLVISANARATGFAGPLSQKPEYFFPDGPDFEGAARVNPAQTTSSDVLLSQVLLSGDECNSSQVGADGAEQGGCTYNATSLQFEIVPTALPEI